MIIKVDPREHTKESYLRASCELGRVEYVKALIDHHGFIGYHRNTNGISLDSLHSCLEVAVRKNYIDIVKYLLSLGRVDHESAFMTAICYCDLEMVKLFHIHGKVNLQDKTGHGLNVACANRNEAAFVYLLRHGCPIQPVLDTLLRMSIGYRNLCILRYLLDTVEFSEESILEALIKLCGQSDSFVAEVFYRHAPYCDQLIRNNHDALIKIAKNRHTVIGRKDICAFINIVHYYKEPKGKLMRALSWGL